MMNEKTFYDLSLLAYFDTYAIGISVADMIRSILANKKLAYDMRNNLDFLHNTSLLEDIRIADYEDIFVKEYCNDNAASGVVYYVFENPESLFFSFRGSEALDDVYGTTKWQDWKDNFRMFLQNPTFQQIFTLHKVQHSNIQKPFYLCGHSKGGNLALYVALTMRQDIFDKLCKVVSFNAPGITKEIRSMYHHRANDPVFIKKLVIIENENDCISSFFENLTTPLFIKSQIPCTNIMEVYQNHNLYAMNFKDNMYVLAEKKSAVPKLFYHFINNFFVNLKKERLHGVVRKMDAYFDEELSMDALLKVLLCDASRYISLFEDIPDEEMSTITFQELFERRKTKYILAKVRELQPKDAIGKVKDTLRSAASLSKLHEREVKEITQSFMDTYELLVKEKAKEFHAKINENNRKIISAIRSIRTKENEE